MASNTEKSENKRARNKKNGGRARKRKLAAKSTLSAKEFFAACGEPGKAAPAAAKK